MIKINLFSWVTDKVAGLGSALLESLVDFFDILMKWIFGSAIEWLLTEVFTHFNDSVADLSETIMATPSEFNGTIFSFIQTVCETAALPCAVIILTLVMCYELIMMIIDKNNMHDVSVVDLYKWCFKTMCAIMLVDYSFDIVNGIFDLAKDVTLLIDVNSLNFDNLLTSDEAVENLMSNIEEMSGGEVLGTFIGSVIVWIAMWVTAIQIHLAVLRRMLEVYMMISVAPIPMATLGNREWGQIGQNYIKAIFGLAFQMLFYVISLYAFGVIASDITVDGANPLWSVTLLVGYSFVLASAFSSIGSYSNRVFGTS